MEFVYIFFLRISEGHCQAKKTHSAPSGIFLLNVSGTSFTIELGTYHVESQKTRLNVKFKVEISLVKLMNTNITIFSAASITTSVRVKLN